MAGDPHTDLKAMLNAGKLEPYLRHIRFPYLRNLEPDLRIEFSHPITALVGPNGTNKTAILRAIQACEREVSLGRYWFASSLDLIDQPKRPRYIHGWRIPSTGVVEEAMKSRAPSDKDPDYWEPIQATMRDGMAQMPAGGILNEGRKRNGERSADRWNAIPKSTVYFDFRSSLSAFDRFFLHSEQRFSDGKLEPLLTSLRRRRTRVRQMSPHIRSAIDFGSKSVTFNRSERILEHVLTLSQDQIQAVSTILGRDYTSIRTLKHRFFGVSGFTVLMKSNGLEYSEAFAGSGEYAVVRFVVEVLAADAKSLLIIDEPEVSLHPGAQRRLMDFLSVECRRQAHQAVIATHSPSIVESLPPDAIKVLSVRPGTGSVTLLSQVNSAKTAFSVLGSNVNKTRIIVEDSLAAEVVKRALRLERELLDTCEVIVFPGGAEAIKSACVDWSIVDSTHLVMLDGDKHLGEPRPDGELGDDEVAGEVERISGVKHLPFRLNGSGGTSVGKVKAQRQYLLWWSGHVRFLPGTTPEDWLLDDKQAANSKVEWVSRTRESLGLQENEGDPPSDEILAEQKRTLARREAAKFVPVLQTMKDSQLL